MGREKIQGSLLGLVVGLRSLQLEEGGTFW